MAVVKPLYKKGDKFEISDYRPISLLLTFAKIFEKAMYSRLSQHLQTNNILAPEQYTFKKGKSTENATFRLTDSVLKSLNQKLCVGGMFCNLSKASDCVNHKILLTKLHCNCIVILFTVRRSIQDSKIHVDMDIVIYNCCIIQ